MRGDIPSYVPSAEREDKKHGIEIPAGCESGDILMYSGAGQIYYAEVELTDQGPRLWEVIHAQGQMVRSGAELVGLPPSIETCTTYRFTKPERAQQAYFKLLADLRAQEPDQKI